MKTYLSLDIGLRRTGVAYADSDSRIALPQETIHHSSTSQLRDALLPIVLEKNIDVIIVGLPLLLSGKEGSQSEIVRKSVSAIPFPSSVELVFLDERYTTPRELTTNPDASAACNLLHTYLDRERLGKN